MSGELSIVNNSSGFTLGSFDGECFEFERDLYIIINQDQYSENPFKKTSDILCFCINEPYVVALPESTIITPVDLKITAS